MTPTRARCKWCRNNHAIDARMEFAKHYNNGQPCKGSGKHKDQSPRKKAGKR